MWSHNITNPVSMRTTDGNVSEVDLYATNNGLWLDRGWSRIAAMFKVQQGDAILFKYMGKSFFDVIIFSKSCIELVSGGSFPVSVPINFVVQVQKGKQFSSLVSEPFNILSACLILMYPFQFAEPLRIMMGVLLSRNYQNFFQ